MNTAWIPVLLAVAASTAVAQEPQRQKPRKIYSNSYLGKAPPELAVAKGAAWINSKGETLKKLKGRVVWLEFSFIH